jgi:Family of unknown function (DUF5946)
MLAASHSGDIMLTLYSYPELFGVADNNGYGLKGTPMTAGSREAYHELSYYTLAHPDPSFIHQHIVDAYIAQSANADTKPIAIAFSLIGLCLYVEDHRSGRDVQRVHMELARNRKTWPTFKLPQQRGTMTVSDVLAAPPGDERDDLIRQWCMSVWDAWQQSHASVRALFQEALPPARARKR